MTFAPAAGDSGARPGVNGATAEDWRAASARWGPDEGAHHSKAQAWFDGMPSELSFSGAYIPQRPGVAAAAAGDGGVPTVDEARVCALEQQVQARLRALQRSTRWHARRLLRTVWVLWRGGALEVRGSVGAGTWGYFVALPCSSRALAELLSHLSGTAQAQRCGTTVGCWSL